MAVKAAQSDSSSFVKPSTIFISENFYKHKYSILADSLSHATNLTPGEKYILGVCYKKKNAFDTGEKIFKQMLTQKDAVYLEPLILYHLGDIYRAKNMLILSNRYYLRLLYLNREENYPSLKRQALFNIIENYKALKQWNNAKKYLIDLLEKYISNYSFYKDIFSNEPVKTDIMLEIAKIDIMQKKYDDAFIYLKRIITEFGASEAATAAFGIIDRNRKNFQDLIDTETEIELAMIMMNKGQYTRALPLLKTLYDTFCADSKLNEAPELTYSLGYSYYKLKSSEYYDTANMYFDSTVMSFPASSNASKALFYKGVILMWKEQLPLSIPYMEKIIQNNNNDYFSFAAFKEILEFHRLNGDKKSLVSTFERMKDYFNFPYKKKYYIESLWQYFFYAMQIKDYAKASDIAETLRSAGKDDESNIIKSNFWLMKLNLRINDNQAAFKCYEEILKTENVNSYYFWRGLELVKKFLAESDYPLTPMFDSGDETSLHSTLLNLAKERKILSTLALYRDYESLGLLTDFNDKSEHGKKLKIIIRYMSGKYSSALDNAAKLPKDDLKDFITIMYPKPYKDYVMNNAAQLSFDTLLPFAIMREESKFTKGVKSIAGAMGLMQIMPATGKGIAAELDYIDFDSSSLFLPEINIKFGVYELRRLFNNWREILKDDIAAAVFTIASYNAGETNVRRWKPKYYDINGDIDLFIEYIPYKETRNYVFRVYKSYKIYQALK